jgi:DNA-binding MarR family transcriptional regulator
MKDTRTASKIWRDYQILDEIARNENVSQRNLAGQSGVALGQVNQVLKRLVRKGLVKTSRVNAKRVAYYLTPQGFTEKLRLVVEYTQLTINLFSCVRRVVSERLNDLVEREAVETVAILGTGELAEAAYLSIQETGLDLAAVYDVRGARNRWFGRPVRRAGDVPPRAIDVVVVTEMEDGVEARRLAGQVGQRVIELRELLSESLAMFAQRVSEDDPARDEAVFSEKGELQEA